MTSSVLLLCARPYRPCAHQLTRLGAGRILPPQLISVGTESWSLERVFRMPAGLIFFGKALIGVGTSPELYRGASREDYFRISGLTNLSTDLCRTN